MKKFGDKQTILTFTLLLVFMILDEFVQQQILALFCS